MDKYDRQFAYFLIFYIPMSVLLMVLVAIGLTGWRP
jgi:hypothetical protein